MVNKLNINKVLLDLDGPLVDDIAMFQQLSPTTPQIEDHIQVLMICGKKQEFMFPLIFEAIEKGLFEKAKPTLFYTAIKDLLIPYWLSLGIEVEILSSTMHTNPLRKELEQQKIKWCNKYLPNLKLNLSEGSAKKQDYAGSGVLLIDDFGRTISQFISKGGCGIHYTSLNSTMKQLRLIGLTP